MVDLIYKAKIFAYDKHKDQLDDAENSYYAAHLLNVFNILSNVTIDENLLCAGLLHDTIEDAGVTYEELVKEFNKDIADLVMEVTHEGNKDSHGYYFPRLKSKNGITLKFADRLSNVSRMGCWNEDRQKKYLKKSTFWKSKPKKLDRKAFKPTKGQMKIFDVIKEE